MANTVAMRKVVMRRDVKLRLQRNPSTRLTKNMISGTAGII